MRTEGHSSKEHYSSHLNESALPIFQGEQRAFKAAMQRQRGIALRCSFLFLYYLGDMVRLPWAP